MNIDRKGYTSVSNEHKTKKKKKEICLTVINLNQTEKEISNNNKPKLNRKGKTFNNDEVKANNKYQKQASSNYMNDKAYTEAIQVGGSRGRQVNEQLHTGIARQQPAGAT